MSDNPLDPSEVNAPFADLCRSHPDKFATVYNDYAIGHNDPSKAKAIACKVANDGKRAPTLDELTVLQPTAADLAEGMVIAGNIIVDLGTGLAGHAGAERYVRVWAPIVEERAERLAKTPRSLLLYGLYLCLLAAEEVQEWSTRPGTNLVRTGETYKNGL